MMKCTFKECDRRTVPGLIWLMAGEMADCCVHGTEHADYIKGEGFLGYARDC
jgi:hypothetical protein